MSVHKTNETKEALLTAKRLLTVVGGSHSYGTNHAGSDVDTHYVVALPAHAFLGFFSPRIGDLTNHQAASGGDDFTFHEVGKFAHLALSANPTVLELLFTDPEQMDEWGAALREVRNDTLSSSLVRDAYLGFMRSQMHGAELEKSDSKTEKYHRHFHRLAMQVCNLWTTGDLRVRLTDEEREFVMAAGKAMDFAALGDMYARTEKVLSGPTPLPEQPRRDRLESVVRAARRAAE